MPVSVWHDPRIELPECSGEVFVLYCGETPGKAAGGMTVNFSARWQFFNAYDCVDNCEHAWGPETVMRWAYPDDILPDDLKGALE